MAFGDRDYYRPTGFGGFSFFPPVIKNIMIINVIVFFFSVVAGSIAINGPITLLDWIMQYFALIPFSNGKVYIDGMRYMTASFYPWQLITYQFLHDTSQLQHILFNMFFLWMFGMEIENMWGAKKFLIFYLLCGIGAGLLQLSLSPGGGPTIGASGAVYGVLIAFGMFFPDRYIYIWFLIPVKAKYLIAVLVLVEFMSVGDMSFVAHLAHIGGALTGVIFILLDRKYNFDFNRLFNSSSKPFSKPSSGSFSFRRPEKKGSIFNRNVEDAEFYEINGKKEEEMKVTQEEIDRILDKISESGYQNLTAREKKILFEASKRN